MTTLVTGATGHIGNNLVRALLERGEKVRVLLRRTSPTRAIEGLDVERAYGDLRDERSLEKAVDGCERIYHTAAMISIRDADRRQMFDVNVLGARRLMRAARRSQVKRVVHTSSFGAIGTNPSGASDEEWTLSPFEPVMAYERSKAHAEWEVMREAAKGLDVVMVNPCATVGPYDFRPSLVGKSILEFAEGRLWAYVPGSFEWVPMRDVVNGHLLAMEKGNRGERYLLSGEVCSIDEILSWLSDFTGRRKPRLRLAPKPMQAISLVKDWVERKYFPETAPRFNYYSIRILNSGKRADNTKAKTQLGLEPTSVKRAFSDTISWFRGEGYL